MKPTVSVVMANYNTPIEYLKEAVDSILCQTFEDFEFIIVDDGSSDKSLSYIKQIDDDRIVVLENGENRGLAASRNRGMKVARGKYIAFMDSDDISLPERLETEVEFMESHPDVTVCGSWFEKFGIENVVRKPVIDDNEYYRCQLIFCNTPITMCNPSVMLRKENVEKYGLYTDEDMRNSEDYCLWTKISPVGKFAIIKKVLLKYRTHDNQMSTAGVEKQRYFSTLICKRQLSKLGMNEVDLDFCPTWRYGGCDGVCDFLSMYGWLKKIISANEETKIYKDETLRRYIEKLIIRGLKNNKKYIITIYCKSDKYVKSLIRKLAFRKR